MNDSRPTAPQSDPYFDHPKFLKRWHRILMKAPVWRGVWLAIILIILAGGVFLMSQRLTDSPEWEEKLPAEQLIWYAEGDLARLANELPLSVSPAFGVNSLNQGIDEMFGGEVWQKGYWQGSALFFDEGINPENPLKTINAFKIPSKKKIEAKKYEKDVTSSVLENEFLFDATDEAFETRKRQIEEGSLNAVKNSNPFLAIRPNLPYHPDFFQYFNSQWVEEEGKIVEHNFLKWILDSYPQLEKTVFAYLRPLTMIQAYPISALALNPNENGWIAQTYWWSNKALADGSAMFHNEVAYRGLLTRGIPAEINTVYGGVNLAYTLERGVELLNRADGRSNNTQGAVGAQLLKVINRFLKQMLGEGKDFFSLVAPLFRNEYVIGYFFPANGRWILGLELDDSTRPAWENLKFILSNEGIIEMDESTSTIRRTDLALEQEKFNGETYSVWRRDGIMDMAYFYETGDAVWVATGVDEMRSVMTALDKESASWESTPEYSGWKEIMTSGDHGISVRMPQSWGQLKSIVSSFNLFDDGISTTHLLYKQPVTGPLTPEFLSPLGNPDIVETP